MQRTELDRDRFHIPPTEALSFTFDSPTVLTVMHGRIWITLDGDDRDFILSAGSELIIANEVHAVVEALSTDAVLEISAYAGAIRFDGSSLRASA